MPLFAGLVAFAVIGGRRCCRHPHYGLKFNIGLRLKRERESPVLPLLKFILDRSRAADLSIGHFGPIDIGFNKRSVRA
ncbi:hypothetical protein F5146DRAFT_1028347 [Armillaria mellea]|nr:hypothetical protein F5146DRAFT_1028347 [Armillaria mellea]